MEQYSALYSKRFYQDLNKTLAYITNILKNPDAAIALEKEVNNETKKRGKLAKAFKPYTYDKDNNRALYRVKIENFYAFYYIDEKRKLMKYVAFLYARMDVNNILGKIDRTT